MLPAGERRPDEVVVGEPVVEHRDERLPLRVALIHRRPRAAPLLHLRQRWTPPAATAPRLPLPRSRLLRERVLASRVWRFLSASAAEPLRCEQRAEGDPMLGAERGELRDGRDAWAGPGCIWAGSHRCCVKLGWRVRLLINACQQVSFRSFLILFFLFADLRNSITFLFLQL